MQVHSDNYTLNNNIADTIDFGIAIPEFDSYTVTAVTNELVFYDAID
jgi:hypothetical protein